MATPEHIARSITDHQNTHHMDMAEVVPLHPHQIDGDFFETSIRSTELLASEPRWVRETMFGEGKGDKDRIRRTGFIDVLDHPHLVRVSEPQPGLVADGAPIKHRILLPGWTEVADGGTAKKLHDAVARANPDERTVTIATDGMSVHGHALAYSQAIERPFHGMAQARQHITKRLAGDAPVEVIGTSMGSVLALMTALHNIHTDDQNKVNIVGLKFLSPGIIASQIPKHEAFRPSLDSTAGRIGTFVKFLGHMGVDSIRESARHPADALDAVLGFMAVSAAIAKEPDKATAVLGNLLQLMEGTPWENIKTVAEHYPITVITGSKDTLREEAQLETLKAMYPHSFNFKIVRGKGHAMSLAAHKTAAALNAITH
jgi:pimeloyl-ACP methyl ester carboxylesterase